MRGKILIIKNGDSDWTARMMKATGLVDVADAYKQVSYTQRRLRTLHYHFPGSKSYWYGAWKDSIQNYDTIILFDVFLASDMPEYIEKYAPQARLIVYYQNPWYNNYHLSNYARQNCEIWSFDLGDCKKYKLQYNRQFYFYQATQQPKDAKYVSDIFFIGRDKGRLKFLQDLSQLLGKDGFATKIFVIPDRISYGETEKEFLHRERMPYEEVLKYNKNTRCLLEVVQKFQKGLTLRAVEAMFFGKKLLTTNQFIDKYDFYDPLNVYIIGKDTRSLKDFVADQNTAVWNPKIVHKYSFEDWLHNFDK